MLLKNLTKFSKIMFLKIKIKIKQSFKAKSSGYYKEFRVADKLGV